MTYKIIYFKDNKNYVGLEKNPNGSFTLSNDKHKKTYYNYPLRKAFFEFKKEFNIK